MATTRIIREIVVEVDGEIHCGTYYKAGRMVYVSGEALSGCAQIGRLEAPAAARVLLRELVTKAQADDC